MTSIIDSIKNIFSGTHTGSVVGIDIGSVSIKVVELEKVDGMVLLRNYGEIALGPRAGVSVGQATMLPPEKIAEVLKEILQETGITTPHTVFAIPFSASLLTVVELPDVGEKQLESMIPLEARRYIPVPLTEVSLDWWALPKKENKQNTLSIQKDPGEGESPARIGTVEVLIAAIHNDVIKKYETIRTIAHIDPASSHFEIEIFSTLRAVAGNDPTPLMVIDIGGASSKLVLVEGGVMRGSHSVNVGGQDITTALSKSLSIPFKQAEEIKCQSGLLGEEEGRDVSVASEGALNSIFSEAVHFVENYEQKYATKIQKIILVGGGARLKGIDAIAKSNFSTKEVIFAEPFTLARAPAFLAETLKDINQSFAVAVGLALKGLEE